jgi:hypothetical protein
LSSLLSPLSFSLSLSLSLSLSPSLSLTVNLTHTLPACVSLPWCLCENEILCHLLLTPIPLTGPFQSTISRESYCYVLNRFFCGFDCISLCLTNLASFFISLHFLFLRFYFCCVPTISFVSFFPFFPSFLERLWKQACNRQYGHHHCSPTLWTGGPRIKIIPSTFFMTLLDPMRKKER